VRALVVDDSKPARSIVARTLVELRFDCTEAGNGQEGKEDKGLEGNEDDGLEGKGQEGDDSKGQEGNASNNQEGNEDNGFEGNIHADDMAMATSIATAGRARTERATAREARRRLRPLLRLSRPGR